MEPLVSVVIPTYNRAALLPGAVRSVLAQSYRAIECIVVDDGSTDGTREALAALDDPRLKYVYQENAGACAARNRGAALAGGEYIAFHDSDDTWRPDKLARQMRVMREKGPDIVVCKLLARGPDGAARQYPRRVGEGFLSPADDLFGIGTQTVLARRRVLETTRFDDAFPRYQDLEWLYRALKTYSVYCLDAPLVDYAVGADSISANPRKLYQAVGRMAEAHPELRARCPAMSMHIVKNLLENWRAFEPASAGEARDYWRLVGRFYPGALRYLASRLGRKR